MNNLVKMLIQDKRIKTLIDEISNLEINIKNSFNSTPTLKWTILEYQQYLQEIIKTEARKLGISDSNMHILINKSLLKFSAIFPPSIGDYRINENWCDYRSAALIILQNSPIKKMIKIKSIPFFQKIIEETNLKITNNKNILKTMPLFEFETIDLIKRAILSFFAGLENINEVKLLSSKYNHTLPNNIEYRFFKVNCLDKNKLLVNKHLINYWNNELLIYEDYIDKNLLDFKNINIKVNWGFGIEELQYYENHWIIDSKFTINYNNKEKKFINKVISQIIKLINTKSEIDQFDELLEKIWNNKVIWNIKQYERLVNSISNKYFKLVNFKTNFKNIVQSIIDNNKFELNFNDEVAEKLFKNVSIQLQLENV